MDRQSFLPPMTPRACVRSEDYVVFHPEPDGLRIVETHRTSAQAMHAVEVLNRHEPENGRDASYAYVFAPATPGSLH